MKFRQEEEVSALKMNLAEVKKDMHKAKKESAQVLSQNTLLICLLLGNPERPQPMVN